MIDDTLPAGPLFSADPHGIIQILRDPAAAGTLTRESDGLVGGAASQEQPVSLDIS